MSGSLTIHRTDRHLNKTSLFSHRALSWNDAFYNTGALQGHRETSQKNADRLNRRKQLSASSIRSTVSNCCKFHSNRFGRFVSKTFMAEFLRPANVPPSCKRNQQELMNRRTMILEKKRRRSSRMVSLLYIGNLSELRMGPCKKGAIHTVPKPTEITQAPIGGCSSSCRWDKSEIEALKKYRLTRIIQIRPLHAQRQNPDIPYRCLLKNRLKQKHLILGKQPATISI